MAIQTSQVTTANNGDLNISPNGTGQTKVNSVAAANPGTSIVAIGADKALKDLNINELTEKATVDDDDWAIVHDSISGNIVKVPGSELGGAAGGGGFYEGLEYVPVVTSGGVDVVGNRVIVTATIPGSGAMSQVFSGGHGFPLPASSGGVFPGQGWAFWRCFKFPGPANRKNTQLLNYAHGKIVLEAEYSDPDYFSQNYMLAPQILLCEETPLSNNRPNCAVQGDSFSGGYEIIGYPAPQISRDATLSLIDTGSNTKKWLYDFGGSTSGLVSGIIFTDFRDETAGTPSHNNTSIKMYWRDNATGNETLITDELLMSEFGVRSHGCCVSYQNTFVTVSRDGDVNEPLYKDAGNWPQTFQGYAANTLTAWMDGNLWSHDWPVVSASGSNGSDKPRSAEAYGYIHFFGTVPSDIGQSDLVPIQSYSQAAQSGTVGTKSSCILYVQWTNLLDGDGNIRGIAAAATTGNIGKDNTVSAYWTAYTPVTGNPAGAPTKVLYNPSFADGTQPIAHPTTHPYAGCKTGRSAVRGQPGEALGESHTEMSAYGITVVNGVFNFDVYDHTLEQIVTLPQPSVALNAGDTLIFDQSDASNAGHTLKIYDDINKTNEIFDGVTVVGTAGTDGETIWSPTEAGVYSYQSENAAGMGGVVEVLADDD